MQVPDGVFEPYRFCLAFLATARLNGAVVRTYHEVTDLICSGKSMAGVKVKDFRTGKSATVGADLVVDVSSFFQRISASDMSITRHSEPLLPLSVDDLDIGVQPEAVEVQDNLSQFSRFESCIECGICMSACPTVAADEKFLGPAGLAAIYRARKATDDPQEAAHLLALADGEHGVWRCHSAFECTEACPQAVDPAGKIMALRRELTVRRFKKIWRR